jgi:hypothetical protein
VNADSIWEFLGHLGESWAGKAVLYLLGGSALCLLGSPRETRDLDYTAEVAPESEDDFRRILAELGASVHIDVEEIPIADFIPLPALAYERRRFVGRFGQLDVYVFDPYTIALSKIARGFESDLEDVMFMLSSGLIEFSELERDFQAILPHAGKADIDPHEFRAYFAEIKRRL